ncbi:MAG: four helix bundle protein [Kouleothrix sp.]|nr:four helix bundle protein [Kouleothrix sp.]
MGGKIRTHRELEAYRKAFDTAMEIFELSRGFPREETYSLTDQIRRSSRSVCANLAEAWRKRRYEKAFVAKLCDAESEAAETQVWLEFALKCGYIQRDNANALYQACEEVTKLLVSMIASPEKWTIGYSDRSIQEASEEYEALL